MKFETFSRINLQRAQRWHKGGLETWTVERWSNAFAGEAGEVCNAVKKLNRVQDSMQQAAGDTPAPLDEEQALTAVRKEIGDAYTYLDLLAQRIGTSVEDCARDAFNFISAREGFPERMPLGEALGSPDGYAVLAEDCNFVGIWRSEEVAKRVVANNSHHSKGERVAPMIFQRSK